MTLDLDCQRANGRKAFPGVNWQFPVQLSRVVGLTGHVNDRSAKAYLGAFKGALKGLIFSQFVGPNTVERPLVRTKMKRWLLLGQQF